MQRPVLQLGLRWCQNQALCSCILSVQLSKPPSEVQLTVNTSCVSANIKDSACWKNVICLIAFCCTRTEHPSSLSWLLAQYHCWHGTILVYMCPVFVLRFAPASKVLLPEMFSPESSFIMLNECNLKHVCQHFRVSIMKINSAPGTATKCNGMLLWLNWHLTC